MNKVPFPSLFNTLSLASFHLSCLWQKVLVCAYKCMLHRPRELKLYHPKQLTRPCFTHTFQVAKPLLPLRQSGLQCHSYFKFKKAPLSYPHTPPTPIWIPGPQFKPTIKDKKIPVHDIISPPKMLLSHLLQKIRYWTIPTKFLEKTQLGLHAYRYQIPTSLHPYYHPS